MDWERPNSRVLWAESAVRMEFGPGELSLLTPGHDSWVMSNEPVVVIRISGMANYAHPD
jgi:hypothetical protein